MASKNVAMIAEALEKINSLDDLDEIIEMASAKAKVIRDKAKASFLAKMRTDAEKLGLSMDDLVSVRGPSNYVPRWQHPKDDKKVWSGRGPKPGWYKELETAGIKAIDLMEAKAKAA